MSVIISLAEKEMIQKVLALWTDPAKFTTQLYARNDKGWGDNPLSETACCFCFIGAACKVTGKTFDEFWDTYKTLVQPMRDLAKELFPTDDLGNPYNWNPDNCNGFANINDTLGYSRMIKLLNKLVA